MSKLRGALIATMTVGTVVVTALPALAYTSSKTVSCDVAYVTNLATLYSGGSVSVKQNSSSEHINSYYDGVSSNGNSLGRKAAGDGGTAPWSNVGNSNYTFKQRIVSN